MYYYWLYRLDIIGCLDLTTLCPMHFQGGEISANITTEECAAECVNQVDNPAVVQETAKEDVDSAEVCDSIIHVKRVIKKMPTARGKESL